MNRMLLVSVHDMKAKSYSFPTVSANKATAIRDFETVVNTPGSLINQHPEDFLLVKVASFDSSDGVVMAGYEMLAKGTDVLKKAEL